MAHICHGKTYFSTAKLTFPRQNLLFHGKTYFLTAKLTFPRQNLLFYGKTYFLTAKLTFPRQNLLFHGKTYFSIPSFQSVSAYAFPRRTSGKQHSQQTCALRVTFKSCGSRTIKEKEPCTSSSKISSIR